MSNDIEMTGDNIEKVAILDAGAQYGKVIDRRVRELFIHSVILPLNSSPANLKKLNVKAVIISGGPGSVFEENAPNWDASILNSGIPILGICYGMQLINRDTGGRVVSGEVREDGQFRVKIEKSLLYEGLAEEENFLLTHKDICVEIAPEYRQNASHGNICVGIENEAKKIYGVQFHPEVDLSTNGKIVIFNFLTKIAGCTQNFTLQCRQTSCLNEIREAVGKNNVLSLVSGGVDSTVCTILLQKAIGVERVIAVHIDNGFLRKDESEKVKQLYEYHGLKLHVYNEKHHFLHSSTRIPKKTETGTVNIQVGPLHSVTDPEEKRKIIGDTFIEVCERILNDLKLDPETTLLAQGTLRPDLIESASHLASGNACTIKTHHNDTNMVRQLREKGRIVEPLKDFHKDEVRALGRQLGVPHALVNRHPFPGPGLAIRVLCAEETFMCKNFSEINNILNFTVNFSNALKKPHPLLNRILNGLPLVDIEMLKEVSSRCSFSSILLPIKTVGVQGDVRTYSYVAALSSDDEYPCWESLMKLAKVIPRVCAVNRVVYVFGGTIKYPVNEITYTTLTEPVLETLRQADYLVNETIFEHGLVEKITQMPIILIPVHFDVDPVSRNPVCQRSIVIRPFITNDFMTGFAAQPGKDIPIKVLQEIVRKINTVPGISRVLYDLTSKPPGTVEWE
ncbi:GMP synthase [glutamine-hydrolyzing] isoform X2 [Hydra vulgaris]|uniref:GMP synthase (glutamine-hydrolyzing) n=1 Tax=Hydra vulgaris TaxID=6087 RepID=A0ABM4D5H2_HYDVU